MAAPPQPRSFPDMLLIAVDIGTGHGPPPGSRSLGHQEGLVRDLRRRVAAAGRPWFTEERTAGRHPVLCAPRDRLAAEGGGGAAIEAMVSAFTRRLADLADTNTCTCEACLGMHRIRLRMAVHAGGILRPHAGGGAVSGKDVQLVGCMLDAAAGTEHGIVMSHAAMRVARPAGLWQACPLPIAGCGVVHAHGRPLPPAVRRAAINGLSLPDSVRKLRYLVRWVVGSIQRAA